MSEGDPAGVDPGPALDPAPALEGLLAYALRSGLIGHDDEMWAVNRILEVLRIDAPGSRATVSRAPGSDAPGGRVLGSDVEAGPSADEAVAPLLDFAVATGLIPDTPGRRDLLDAAIFGALMPRPTEVIRSFWADFQTDPRRATDAFYRLSVAANYIHADRSDRNPRWTYASRFGEIDMTINLAKPEKDPRDIIAAGATAASGYPLCLLCPQNEGYAGRIDHPARQNLRLIPLEFHGEPWALQYSPYLYYPEHCIVLSQRHVPMQMTRMTFTRLLDFVGMFPEYFLGSNADLPIVGGSILSHDHFQGGRYEFPIERASTVATLDGPHGVKAELLNWPLATVRLTGADADVLGDLGFAILQAWRGHDEPETDVVAVTDQPHNTVTPIARRSGRDFQLDVVLRNNRTSAEHPDGIFHPHAEIHPVKKENIGLIEVMGWAVLPGRLATDIPRLAGALRERVVPHDLAAHQPMLDAIRTRGGDLGDPETAVRSAVGEYFVTGLEHCGVFGDPHEATDRWLRLLEPLGFRRV